MEQTEQSANNTEQPTHGPEQPAAATEQTGSGGEKPSGIVRGLIEAAKIVLGMIVFIGLAIYSKSHHPHPPVH